MGPAEHLWVTACNLPKVAFPLGAVYCSSVPQSSTDKYVPATGFGLTVDVLCADNGKSGLMAEPETIECESPVAGVRPFRPQ